ncbi:hypothetical protein M433DRAFT_534129 [Acidomyces richmondensis BFW]|nr:hypothetical protein M433DRAFT_534129 [Acidomyces richmondensis BFW]
MVASMLCLDISGAFDNVSYQRLIHNLKMKGFPPTITGFVRPQPTGIPQGPTTALGFVDNTNILTFGKTTEENCQRLEVAHTKCLRWVAQHGAAFAP